MLKLAKFTVAYIDMSESFMIGLIIGEIHISGNWQISHNRTQ